MVRRFRSRLRQKGIQPALARVETRKYTRRWFDFSNHFDISINLEALGKSLQMIPFSLKSKLVSINFLVIRKALPSRILCKANWTGPDPETLLFWQ